MTAQQRVILLTMAREAVREHLTPKAQQEQAPQAKCPKRVPLLPVSKAA